MGGLKIHKSLGWVIYIGRLCADSLVLAESYNMNQCDRDHLNFNSARIHI